MLFFRSEQQRANAAAAKMLYAGSVVFVFSNPILSYAFFYTKLFAPKMDRVWIVLRKTVGLLYSIPMLTNGCANFPVLWITMKSFRHTLRKFFEFA